MTIRFYRHRPFPNHPKGPRYLGAWDFQVGHRVLSYTRLGWRVSLRLGYPLRGDHR